MTHLPLPVSQKEPDVLQQSRQSKRSLEEKLRSSISERFIKASAEMEKHHHPFTWKWDDHSTTWYSSENQQTFLHLFVVVAVLSYFVFWHVMKYHIIEIRPKEIWGEAEILLYEYSKEMMKLLATIYQW